MLQWQGLRFRAVSGCSCRRRGRRERGRACGQRTVTPRSSMIFVSCPRLAIGFDRTCHKVKNCFSVTRTNQSGICHQFGLLVEDQFKKTSMANISKDQKPKKELVGAHLSHSLSRKHDLMRETCPLHCTLQYT